MNTILKENTGHPSQFLDSALTTAIRSAGQDAEIKRRLGDDQLAIIHRENWLRMFVPKEHGGLALSIPQILRTEECLAWADGSTAWVVTLCSGAAWFAGFLHPDLSAQVFANAHACFAGSGAATGTAQITGEGYEIDGRWKYASGALHATVFTANCMVQKDGQQLYHKDGTPVIRSFLFMKDEVRLHTSWNSMGMIATGSHTFEVKKLKVSSSRSFLIDTAQPVLKHPLYRYPFLQLAETTLTVNLSGMATRFLDLCEALFAEKIKSGNASRPSGSGLNTMLAGAWTTLSEHRTMFYAAAEKSWHAYEAGGEIPDAILQEVSDASRRLAQRSRQIVDELYPYCGLTAADVSQEINRVWRNLHTASQHALFTSR